MARGMKKRGKLAAFGDGKRIIFGPWSEEMFAHNCNIARPGQEDRTDLEYIHHYKGHRLYNKQMNGKWIWDYSFKAKPGEFFWNAAENKIKQTMIPGFIVIEPNVPWQKSVAPNKDWGEQRYQVVADKLMQQGHRIVQFIHGNSRRRLKGISTIQFHMFRHAIAALSQALLYIGPEGGMHHAAAAIGTPAVVLMGGFIPPSVVGYEGHINLTGGADEACGNIQPCLHCKRAMEMIGVDEVVSSVEKLLI